MGKNNDNILAQKTIKQIKEIEEFEFPSRLHGRIMRTIYLRQFKLPLTVINALLFLNLAISTWRVWGVLYEDVVKTVGRIPALSESFSVYFYSLARILPTAAMMMFILSFLLMGAGVYTLVKLRSLIFAAKRA